MRNEKTTYRHLIDYLKGKLSNKERHAIEKEALEDPFLQDALDGFETIDTSALEQDVALLSQKTKERATINKPSTFYIYPIAASLLLLFGLSFWWFSTKQGPEAPTIVQEEVKEEIFYKELDSVLNTATEIVSQEENPEASVHLDQGVKEQQTSKKSSIAHKKKTTQATAQIEQIANAPIEEALENDDILEAVEAVADEKINVKSSSSVVANVDSNKEEIETSVNSSKQETTFDNEVFSKKLKEIETALEEVRISGTVTAEGEPLSDVAVIVKGEIANLTETDSNGNYSITAKKGETLSFFFIGYERKEIVIDDAISIDVELAEEVVEALLQAGKVTYDENDRESLEDSKAIPFNDTEEAFKTWVKSNLKEKYPELIIDKNVTVQIDINEFGEVSEVVVLSNLTKEEQRALRRVIKSSPDWTPSKTQEDEDIPSRVILTIGFVD